MWVHSISRSSRTHFLEATFQGSRSLFIEVSTMHDSCYDLDKNELCRFPKSSLFGNYETSIWKGFFILIFFGRYLTLLISLVFLGRVNHCWTYLLYTRFKTVSMKVAPLLGELERRAQSYPDELSALLSECHSAYFSMRKGLLMPRIIEAIKGLDPSRSELVELVSHL